MSTFCASVLQKSRFIVALYIDSMVWLTPVRCSSVTVNSPGIRFGPYSSTTISWTFNESTLKAFARTLNWGRPKADWLAPSNMIEVKHDGRILARSFPFDTPCSFRIPFHNVPVRFWVPDSCRLHQTWTFKSGTELFANVALGETRQLFQIEISAESVPTKQKVLGTQRFLPYRHYVFGQGSNVHVSSAGKWQV